MPRVKGHSHIFTVRSVKPWDVKGASAPTLPFFHEIICIHMKAIAKHPTTILQLPMVYQNQGGGKMPRLQLTKIKKTLIMLGELIQ